VIPTTALWGNLPRAWANGGWLEYNVSSLADGIDMALLEAKSCNLEDPEALFRLDHHAKSILCCVLRKETITAPEAARELHLSEYMIR